MSLLGTESLAEDGSLNKGRSSDPRNASHPAEPNLVVGSSALQPTTDGTRTSRVSFEPPHAMATTPTASVSRLAMTRRSGVKQVAPVPSTTPSAHSPYATARRILC